MTVKNSNKPSEGERNSHIGRNVRGYDVARHLGDQQTAENSHARRDLRGSNLARHLEGQHMTREAEMPVSQLDEMLIRGMTATAQGGRHLPDGGFRPNPTASRIAGLNGQISLRTAMPNLIDSDGRPAGVPAITRASEQISLRTALTRSSVAVSMGAHLIELPEPTVTNEGGGEPVVFDEPRGLDIIRPAPIEPVELTGSGSQAEGEVTASDMPVSRAEIDRDAMEQLAVRFEVPRSTLRIYGVERVEAQLLDAIAAGLGVALDGVLMRALAEAPEREEIDAPHEVCLRTGVRWAELRGIIGRMAYLYNPRSMMGEPMRMFDGQLTIGGVPAEYSRGAACSIVGAFDRCGIAVSPEVEILVERHGVAGGLTVTAWCDAQALVPDLNYFATTAPLGTRFREGA